MDVVALEALSARLFDQIICLVLIIAAVIIAIISAVKD